MDIQFKSLVNALMGVTPDPLFLLMAAGFLGVIMAFLIPVSIEIISKVSAKYNSDVIVRLFQNNIISKFFPYFVLLNIAAMLVMRFFYGGEFYDSQLGKTIMWLLLIFSVIITALIGYLIYRMEKIISDDSVPLNMLIHQVEKSLKYRANLKKKRVITQPIEGIGDILFYQTRRQNNVPVIKGLQTLEDTITRLLQLKNDNPDKFSQLVYSEEFINYSAQNASQPEKIASFCLANPDEHLAEISYPLNQIERVYLSAVSNNNRQIAYTALKHITKIMHQIATSPDNDIILELFVRKLSNCIQTAIQKNDGSSSMAASWFIKSVFKEPHTGKGAFHIPYLDIYDRYFLKNMQYIINEDKDDNFREVITYMAKHFDYPDYQRDKLWSYNYLLRAADFEKYLVINREHRGHRKVRALIEAENQMYTTAQLKSWLEYFDNLKKIITPHLQDSASKKKATELEEIIKDNATKHLKYTRLIRLTYAIGTLCEIKDNHSYIRYMWETVQENIGEETGLTMIPQTLQAVMNDYLIFHDISERHRVPRNNYRRYIFMLVSRLMNSSARKDFYLPQMYPEYLQNWIDGIAGLITTIESIEINAEEESIRTGKKRDKKEISATKESYDFLNTVQGNINKLMASTQRQATLSPQIKESFQKSFFESFNSRRVIKDIFDKYLGLYENQARAKYKKLSHRPWGITELVTKSTLIGQQDSSKRSGYQYGQSLADTENMTLFDNIMKHCKLRRQHRFEQVLRGAGEPQDLIIISSYAGVNKFLNQQDRLHTARYIPSEIQATATSQGKVADAKYPKHEGEDLSRISGFLGYYDMGKFPIPVFNFYYRGSDNHILILHKKHIGKLVQMPLVESPTKENPTKENPTKEKRPLKLTAGIMKFGLDELSKSRKLMKEYVDNPPPWLKNIGNTKQQKEYLMERVLITALENLTFIKPDKSPFIGYKISIIESNEFQDAPVDGLV